MNLPQEFVFDDQLFQVWVRLDTNTSRNPVVLDQILKKTNHWLDELQASGRISDYSVDEVLLRRVWSLLEQRELGSVKLKVAQGWPPLYGLDVQLSDRKDGHIVCSFGTHNENAKDWHYCWIEAKVNFEIGIFFPKMALTTSTRLYEYWIRYSHQLQHEQCIELAVARPTQLGHSTRPLAILTHDKRGTVELVIYEGQALADLGAIEQLGAEANKKLMHLQSHRPMHRIHLLWKEALRQLEEAREGPARLGLGLPIRILIGFVHRVDLSLESPDAQEFQLWFKQNIQKLSAPVDWMARFRKETPGIPTPPHSDFLVILFNALARESLYSTPADQRFMVTANLVLNPTQLIAVTKLLSDLRDGFLSDSPAELNMHRPYHFLLHFFPMAHFQAKAKVEDPSPEEHPWLNNIIREMTQFPEFYNDPAWVRERLIPAVSPAEIEFALQHLKKYGFIRYSRGKKKWSPGQATIMTDSQLQGEKAFQFYQSVLNLSDKVMTRIPPLSRQKQTATLLLDQEMFLKAKDKIEKSSKEILALETSEPVRTMVYTLFISLFPAP